MKSKRLLGAIITLVLVGIGIYFLFRNIEIKKVEDQYQDYTPQEEISDEQERKTMISLYFVNKTTRNVEPEARMLDVKTLIKDPYTVIINMLIDGPKNENHDNVIPEGTTLIGTSLEGDTLKINFSSEFVENHIGGKEEEQKTIECLVNSLTELTEVNSIKILINGEENAKFKDGEIDFSQNFIRNE